MGVDSDLHALTRNIAFIGTMSDSCTLRENISSLRTQLKRKISNEQVRQYNVMEQFNGDK